MTKTISLLCGLLLSGAAGADGDNVAMMLRTDGAYLRFAVDDANSVYAGVHFFQSRYSSRYRGMTPQYSSPGVALGYRYARDRAQRMRPHIDTLLAYSDDRNEDYDISSDDSRTRGIEFSLAYGVEYRMSPSFSIDAKVGLLYTRDKTTGAVQNSYDSFYAPVTVLGLNYYF